MRCAQAAQTAPDWTSTILECGLGLWAAHNLSIHVHNALHRFFRFIDENSLSRGVPPIYTIYTEDLYFFAASAVMCCAVQEQAGSCRTVEMGYVLCCGAL